ncbi:NAD(P)H-binding protein [Myxococcota bacterium]|nr:NAD(P)H-binding protein [Myxococcota bacterium]
MRVFVTGSTGYIGNAVVRSLVRAGHQVTGLVRSEEQAEVLRASGGEPVRGDLRDPASYRDAALNHEASVHIGFGHGPDAVAVDRGAIEALLDAAAAASTPRTVVYTSGVLCLGPTGDEPADEDTPPDPIPLVAWRPGHEELTLRAATRALTTAVVRPGFVYGGAKGLIAGYFDSVAKTGAASFIGDGTNRMALVHHDDLAELYRLIVERRAGGTFHGVDGGAPRIAELASAASQAAGGAGATRSVPVEQARETMGPFADALCTDQVVVTRRALELGWRPRHPAALEAMGTCYQEWRQAVGR